MIFPWIVAILPRVRIVDSRGCYRAIVSWSWNRLIERCDSKKKARSFCFVETLEHVHVVDGLETDLSLALNQEVCKAGAIWTT